jgi:hypothetical protein
MSRASARGWRIVGTALGCLSVASTAVASPSSAINAGPVGIVPAATVPRLPKTFQFFYNFDPRGWRYETQISSTQWLEVYETGERSYFNVLMEDTVEGCHGLRLMKDNRQLEVFIPDDQCPMQLFKFRFMGPDGPSSGWHAVGRMEKITY